ncbi:MAG: cytochrome c-type biogenesis protein CcmH [Candidatus Methanoperedens sp.]|nr:cytochrome c-type biogenesis protein CcmH [Candidatus Methanoperedens sp.]
MLRVIMLFTLLISGIKPVMADDDMTSGLICPCECAMVISTCDCTTAIQVKKEITQMKESGFSEKQIFSALQAEYGKEILAHPEKSSSMSLWMGGISLSILFVFVGYIFGRKPRMGVIPDIKKYEQRFEEEYHTFVSELNEPDKNIEPFSKDSSNLEGK